MKNYNSIICTLIGGLALVWGCHILTINIGVTVTDKPVTQYTDVLHNAEVKRVKQ